MSKALLNIREPPCGTSIFKIISPLQTISRNNLIGVTLTKYEIFDNISQKYTGFAMLVVTNMRFLKSSEEAGERLPRNVDP